MTTCSGWQYGKKYIKFLSLYVNAINLKLEHNFKISAIYFLKQKLLNFTARSLSLKAQ